METTDLYILQEYDEDGNAGDIIYISHDKDAGQKQIATLLNAKPERQMALSRHVKANEIDGYVFLSIMSHSLRKKYQAAPRRTGS